MPFSILMAVDVTLIGVEKKKKLRAESLGRDWDHSRSRISQSTRQHRCPVFRSTCRIMVFQGEHVQELAGGSRPGCVHLESTSARWASGGRDSKVQGPEGEKGSARPTHPSPSGWM